MTIYSLALRIKEITDLQNEYELTRNPRIVAQVNSRKADLDILVNSIISTYQVPQLSDSEYCYVDVDHHGS